MSFSRDCEKGNIPGSLLNLLVVLLSLAAVGLLMWHYFKGSPSANGPKLFPAPPLASSFQGDPAAAT
ncbi:MAG TPA: hypothetical protein VK859_07080, partial [bacterium]|nr:hypothetical protein [bacterium]